MSTGIIEPGVNTDSLFYASMATPAAIEDVRERLGAQIRELAAQINSAKSPRIYMVGGGASLAALMGANYLLDRFTDLVSVVHTGYQFLARAPLALDEHSFVFLTSYSGETPEVLRARDLAATRGATTIALTNTTETPLAQGASVILDYQSKAVYTAPLAALYLLCAELMRTRGTSVDVAKSILDELEVLPGKVDAVIQRTRDDAQRLAAQFTDAQGFYVLGSGPLYGLAFKLSLSVVIENLWIDAACIDAGEFYHGPIEIIPPDPAQKMRMPVLHLVGTDATREISMRALDFCAKRGAAHLVFDGADHPEFGELFSPFALFVPTEWFIMYMAAQRDHDVDERRYMGRIAARWGDYGDGA